MTLQISARKLLFKCALLFVVPLSMNACVQDGVVGTAEGLKTKAEKEQKAAAQKERKEAISNVPEWFLNPPENPYMMGEVKIVDMSLFVPGTATSKNLQTAIDKGVLNAKRQLADQLSARIKSVMRRIKAESGVDNLTEDTNNVIEGIRISQYRVVKKKVVSEGDRFRSYVLIEYPMGEYNRALFASFRDRKAYENRFENSPTFRALKQLMK